MFLSSDFSLLLTFSSVLKAFLKCLRMCGCLPIFRNEVLKVVQKLCGHGLSTGDFTLGHNSAASQMFFWALPPARLCRPFLWDSLVTAGNSFLIFWVGWFKPSHYHSEHGREETVFPFTPASGTCCPQVWRNWFPIPYGGLMGRRSFVWDGGGALGISNNALPCLTSISVNTWAQLLSLAEDVTRGMLEEHFQAPKRGMSLQIERARWMVRKINEKAPITKRIMLKFQNTKA